MNRNTNKNDGGEIINRSSCIGIAKKNKKKGTREGDNVTCLLFIGFSTIMIEVSNKKYK